VWRTAWSDPLSLAPKCEETYPVLAGKDPGGWIVTILLGIAGALVGGWIGSALWGSAGVTGFNFRSFGLAILGSFILLGVYRLFARRSGTGTPSSGNQGRWAA